MACHFYRFPLKNLVIIGAGGLGREVLWSARGLAIRDGFKVKGFIDNNSSALDGFRGEYPPIISSIDEYQPCPNDIFFCALGDAAQRKHCSEIIESKGGKFHSLILKSAIVSPTAVIGDGCFVDDGVCISDNVTIGKHSLIQRLSTIGHDTEIGNYVTIGAYSFCGGKSSIGDLSTLNVRSTVLKSISVGRKAVVGAGSVVIRNVQDGVHVFGNPAKDFWIDK